MPVHISRKKGFTLIELVVVIAIMGVLASFLLPSFSELIKKQKLEQATEQVKNDLRVVQNRALTGTKQDEYSGWGLILSANSQTYQFCGRTDSGCINESGLPTQSLPEGIVIKQTTAGGKVVFQTITAEVLEGGGETIKVGYADDPEDEWRSITVTTGGQIE